MLWFRSLLFTSYFFLWTGVCSVLVVPAALYPTRAAIQGLLTLWGKGTRLGLKIFCGLGFRVEGLENVPEGGYIVACKHQSAWETLAFHGLLPDPVFVVKKELGNIPFWRMGFRKAGTIDVDREGGAQALRGMAQRAADRVAAGRQVIVFPEGTRTAPGDKVKYHPGTAAMYMKAKAPVVPVALNSGLFWGRLSFLKRPGTIVLKFLPPIPPGLDRRTFMARLEEAIEGESRRLLPEGGPGVIPGVGTSPGDEGADRSVDHRVDRMEEPPSGPVNNGKNALER